MTVNYIFLIIGILFLTITQTTSLHKAFNKKMCHNKYQSRSRNTISSLILLDNNKDNRFNPDNKRKIIKKDNLGEPIYEDELTASGSNGINIFGKKIDADPLTVSLIVFAIIAIQFFGVLFFQ